jgi:hypothetical protein
MLVLFEKKVMRIMRINSKKKMLKRMNNKLEEGNEKHKYQFKKKMMRRVNNK